METVRLDRINETHLRVIADPGIKMEISERFTFIVDGYKFTPAYKFGKWDGRIKLFNAMTGLIYAGLETKIKEFCVERGYAVQATGETPLPNITLKDVEALVPQHMESRDYQVSAAYHAIKNNRSIVLSPTASGKSMIAYLIARYSLNLGRRTLIIVPTVGLVEQMYSDFADYDSTIRVHGIRSGKSRETDADVVVTTWQSAVKLDREFFRDFDVVVGDEAHTFAAKSLTSLMEKMPHARFRTGMTGSLDDSRVNELVLTGLFGPIHRVITTRELQERGTLSSLKIRAVALKYSSEERAAVRAANKHKGMTYPQEIDFIVRHPRRFAYVKNLALSLKGNTLVLFQFVEKHGLPLYEAIAAAGTHEVHLIYGGVGGDKREEIRKTVMNSRGNIIIASYATFSTGVNVPLLDNLVYASPFKGKIRGLQSIGRVLRKSKVEGLEKDSATLYDIVDDLRHKSHENYAVRHFRSRMAIYAQEGFPVKTYEIDI